MLDAQIIARIRWEAEAALSGLDNMPDALALDSARISFEEILDTLELFDNGDSSLSFSRPDTIAGIGREGDAADVHTLDTGHVDPGSPPTGSATIADDSHSIQESSALSPEKPVRLDDSPNAINAGDNVLSFFDRRAEQILNTRNR